MKMIDKNDYLEKIIIDFKQKFNLEIIASKKYLKKDRCVLYYMYFDLDDNYINNIRLVNEMNYHMINFYERYCEDLNFSNDKNHIFPTKLNDKIEEDEKKSITIIIYKPF